MVQRDFFAWHGIHCTPGMSFIGRNMKLCSDGYRFKIIEELMGDSQCDAVIKRCCQGAVYENCVRLVQFMKELVDDRNCYEADYALTEMRYVIAGD